MYPKFDDVYEALLFEQYDLDARRREILKPTWYWTGINVSLLAMSIALLATNWGMSLAIVAIVIWSIVQHERVRKRRNDEYLGHYRTAIVEPTLQTIAARYNALKVPVTLTYDGEASLYNDVIDSSPLGLYLGNERAGSDFISGTYRGMYFKGSSVVMYKETTEQTEGKAADPHTLVAFEGTLLRVELPITCTAKHRLIDGMFRATDWKSALQKQVATVRYKALKKHDRELKELPEATFTDTPFQERFKLHTGEEHEAEKLFPEHVQQQLLEVEKLIKRHEMTLQLSFEAQYMYIVLAHNRYIAHERMQLPLDDKQLYTTYIALVSQLRIVEAFYPAIAKQANVDVAEQKDEK